MNLADFHRLYGNPLATKKPKPYVITYSPGTRNGSLNTMHAIAMMLRKHGLEFATEVVMRDGKRRADMVVPGLATQVIEIQDSESNESIEEKSLYYEKEGIEMLRVPANPEWAVELVKQANGLENYKYLLDAKSK